MKSLTILSGKAMIVELPEGAPTPDVINTGQSHLSWLDIDINLPDINLPPGNWRIIGMLSEVTDEQAAICVKLHATIKKYRDYLVDNDRPTDMFTKTALESLESSIVAEGYAFTNPLGSFDEFDKRVFNHSKDRLKEWQYAQSRVLSHERCLLLRRVDG